MFVYCTHTRRFTTNCWVVSFCLLFMVLKLHADFLRPFNMYDSNVIELCAIYRHVCNMLQRGVAGPLGGLRKR